MIRRVLDRVNKLIGRLDMAADVRGVLDGAGRMVVILIAAVGLNYSSQLVFVRLLGTREFGIYAFAWSLVAPLGMAAALGLGSSAVRFIPQYSVSNEWGRIRGFIRRATAITLCLGGAIAGVGWLGVPALGSWVAEYYMDPVRIALLCVPFLGLCGLLSGASRGFGWVGLAFVPNMLMVPGLVLLGVVGLSLRVDGLTARHLLVMAVAACGVTVLVQAIAFRRAIPAKVRAAQPVYNTRFWLQVAVPLFLSEGVLLLLWSSDIIILGSLTAPDDVAIYQICLKIAALALLFLNATTALAAPRFAALWVEQNAADMARFTRSVARWTFLPTLALVTGVILAGPYILATFGPSFVRGQSVLVVLILGCLAKTTTGPVAAYLSVSGHQNVIMLVTGLAASGNIVLNILLIPHFGLMGVAAATVLADLVYQVLLYGLVRRRLGIDTFFLARG